MGRSRNGTTRSRRAWKRRRRRRQDGYDGGLGQGRLGRTTAEGGPLAAHKRQGGAWPPHQPLQPDRIAASAIARTWLERSADELNAETRRALDAVLPPWPPPRPPPPKSEPRFGQNQERALRLAVEQPDGAGGGPSLRGDVRLVLLAAAAADAEDDAVMTKRTRPPAMAAAVARSTRWGGAGSRLRGCCGVSRRGTRSSRRPGRRRTRRRWQRCTCCRTPPRGSQSADHERRPPCSCWEAPHWPHASPRHRRRHVERESIQIGLQCIAIGRAR